MSVKPRSKDGGLLYSCCDGRTTEDVAIAAPQWGDYRIHAKQKPALANGAKRVRFLLHKQRLTVHSVISVPPASVLGNLLFFKVLCCSLPLQ